MSSPSAKPVIFISYSHKDEPEQPRDDEIQWLSFVLTYLQPAVKDGIHRPVGRSTHAAAGRDWEPEIEQKLRACDIFILLVSRQLRWRPTTSSTRRSRSSASGKPNGEAFISIRLLLTPHVRRQGSTRLNDN